jgi:hypothetical protein
VTECGLLNPILETLAMKHPRTKFLRSVATKCIENFLDADCPGLLFYKNAELVHNIIPAREVIGGKRMNEKTVEFVLATNNMIQMEFEHDPRDKLKLINTVTKRGKDAGHGHEDDVSDEGEDDREYVNNQYTRYK